MADAQIGIIGGTGLGDLLLREAGGRRIAVDTPFGPPSTAPILANWEGADVAFIARHGEGHRFNPSNVPYRANVWAMKMLGVSGLIASGATGSLREDIEPGQLVLCDQVIDKTYRRASTFFDAGPVVHVDFADPFCPWLRSVLSASGQSLETTVHHAGTYVCMEGPHFSTRAESQLHRLWGGDVIGMTCLPEAKLAREAELCYALIALPTDYDCWRPAVAGRAESDLLEQIIANLNRASETALELLRRAVRSLPTAPPACRCREALRLAVWSAPTAISEDIRARLRPLLTRHLTDNTE